MYREGDVEQVLLRLGIDATQRRSELNGYCPMHFERVGREDTNPSWSINIETGVHHCFSCGYKGNLLTLVCELNEFFTEWGRLDFDAAKAWLRQNIELDFEALAKQLEELRNSYIALPKPLEMSEARLAVFEEAPEWALSARKLSEEACWAYGVKWNTRDSSWITPIRNPHTNALMGWQEKGQSSRLFRNRPTGVTKSTTLFGYNVFPKTTMIVVESPLDAVRLATVGIHGGVSTFGASISRDQLELMRTSNKLIIAMDNPNVDPAGEKAAKEIFDYVRSSGMECWFFNYGDSKCKDVGDMDEVQIRYGIDNAKHFVFGLGAIYGKAI
jgi:hypothetical protein